MPAYNAVQEKYITCIREKKCRTHTLDCQRMCVSETQNGEDAEKAKAELEKKNLYLLI